MDREDGRLIGWKAIGNFLGRDARTARRWEAERGLPVNRVPGGGSASVWADPAALRSWLNSGAAAAEAGAPSAPRWGWAAGIALLLLSALAAFWITQGRPASTASIPAPPYANDAAANAAFATAHLAMERRTVPGLIKAEGIFARLTQQHPGNAAAYVGLAETNLLLREFNSLPPETAFRRAAIAAEKALTLDPGSHKAMRALAFVRYWSEGDRKAGLALIEKAIRIAPQEAQSHHWYGTMLMGEAPPETALAALDKAFRLNPDSSTIAADRAYGLYLAGRKAAAKEALADLAEIDPEFSNTYAYLERIHLIEGDAPAFLATAEKTARLRLQDDRLKTIIAAKAAFASGGKDALFSALIAAEEKRFEQDGESAMRMAILNAAKGDRDAVRRWLAKAREIKEPGSEAIRAFIEFAPLANDPAFRQFFAR